MITCKTFRQSNKLVERWIMSGIIQKKIKILPSYNIEVAHNIVGLFNIVGSFNSEWNKQKAHAGQSPIAEIVHMSIGNDGLSFYFDNDTFNLYKEGDTFCFGVGVNTKEDNLRMIMSASTVRALVTFVFALPWREYEYK